MTAGDTKWTYHQLLNLTSALLILLDCRISHFPQKIMQFEIKSNIKESKENFFSVIFSTCWKINHLILPINLFILYESVTFFQHILSDDRNFQIRFVAMYSTKQLSEQQHFAIFTTIYMSYIICIKWCYSNVWYHGKSFSPTKKAISRFNIARVLPTTVSFFTVIAQCFLFGQNFLCAKHATACHINEEVCNIVKWHFI